MSELKAFFDGLIYWLTQKYCERFGHLWYVKRFRGGHYRPPYHCHRCGLTSYTAKVIK